MSSYIIVPVLVMLRVLYIIRHSTIIKLRQKRIITVMMEQSDVYNHVHTAQCVHVCVLDIPYTNTHPFKYCTQSALIFNTGIPHTREDYNCRPLNFRAKAGHDRPLCS